MRQHRRSLLAIGALITLTGMCAALVMTPAKMRPQAEDKGKLQHYQKGKNFWNENIQVVDNRKVIGDTTQFPWSAVCKIIATFGENKKWEGTGIMIGPHHCLTARHIIFDGDTLAPKIEIIPGYDGSKSIGDAEGLESLLSEGKTKTSREPFGRAKALSCVYWKDQDVALLITNHNIGKKSRWLGFATRTDERLNGSSAHLAGYPADKDDAERMYYDAGKIDKAEGDALYYNIATYKGQSGAGVFERKVSDRVDEPDKFNVIGIHTQGGKESNSGTRIQKWLFDYLDRYTEDNFSDLKNPVRLPND